MSKITLLGRRRSKKSKRKGGLGSGGRSCGKGWKPNKSRTKCIRKR